MEAAEEQKGGKSYNKRSALPLQGPRPPPLKISKVGIEKIGVSNHQQQHEQPPQQQQQHQRQRQPVIIYTRSPEVIHTKPQDFMQLVQRLTGPSCSNKKKKKKKKSKEKTLSQVMPEPHLTTFKSPSEFTNTTNNTTSHVFPSLPPSQITPSQLYPHGLLSPFPISPLPPFSPSLFTISPNLRFSYSPLQLLDTPSYFPSFDQMFPPPVKDTDQSNNVP